MRTTTLLLAREMPDGLRAPLCVCALLRVQRALALARTPGPCVLRVRRAHLQSRPRCRPRVLEPGFLLSYERLRRIQSCVEILKLCPLCAAWLLFRGN
jgi:hypothetical protein